MAIRVIAGLSKSQVKREGNTTKATQEKIKEKYGDRIEEYTKLYCSNCVNPSLCKTNVAIPLLPVNSDGSLCIYFKEA